MCPQNTMKSPISRREFVALAQSLVGGSGWVMLSYSRRHKRFWNQIATDNTQAAVDASIEFARKSPLPDPEAGVLHTYAAGAAQATQFFNRKGLVNHVNAGQAS